ncbi:GGDEF domain-containing protein [Duganella sp. FT3S]|uniref:GGDEF domain-containing protein n=1 Tax=Rugamonas fusca TaxID=2758568 RepID=A0A7W2EFM5_9BURK|nr:sensor domain-containing diguanylate cyclase [Rugamonas fusca]MBA5604994.1 GGDEF domain-containing protein [Rugamonas fusca]
MEHLPRFLRLDTATLLEVIRTHTEIARCGLDLGGVMALVCERAQALTHATGAIVEIAEGEEMVYRAVAGSAGAQLGLRIRMVGSLSGLCVRSRRILLCVDSETDERVDQAACRKVGLRSMAVIPLLHEDVAVGALKVISTEVNAFNERHTAVLELMSELIGAAMFHAAKLETNALYHSATHDALTNVANRALYYDRLRHGIALAKRRHERFGVLCIDMDGLKTINDHFGHRAGDAAIRAVAQRITATIRDSDLVARVGGDEFCVILSTVQTAANLEQKKLALCDAIERGFEFEGHRLNLGASIGAALYPDDASHLEQLLEAADQRMYTSKRMRKQQSLPALS